MTGADSLMLWIAGFHFIGVICVAALLIPALRSDDTPGSSDSGASSDDGWGNLPADRPRPKLWPGGGMPLPDAVQSCVRLRDHRRLSDLRNPRERRPAHEPSRTPERVPSTRTLQRR
jgi:hypothetical protein